MPYADHLTITMSGEIGPSGAFFERFSMGLQMSYPASTIDWANDSDIVNDFTADCVAFFARPETNISSQTRLTEVKVARIDAFGRYVDGKVSRRMVNQAGGGVSAYRYPLQVALAVSLNTARPGPTGKGRFYLPSYQGILQADTLIDVGVAEATRFSVKTFIDALNNGPGVTAPEPRVTVASNKGYNSDVTSVRIGRALDTIRSRRASLLEKYTANLAVTA